MWLTFLSCWAELALAELVGLDELAKLALAELALVELSLTGAA
jgi:hypothetical protein